MIQNLKNSKKKDEFIVVNKTKLLETIDKHKKRYNELADINDSQWCSIIAGKISELEFMLNNSTPLEPIINNAWDAANRRNNSDENEQNEWWWDEPNKEQYIKNLKI